MLKLLLNNKFITAGIFWWQERPPREKIFLIVGSVSAIILMIYLLLLNPFYASLAQLKQQVNYYQQLAQNLNQANTIITNYKKQGIIPPKINTQSLFVTINNAAQEAKLYQLINKITQGENNTVTIRFSKAPFDQMIQWITKLWQQYGVMVDQIDVTPLKKIGLVKANINFTIETEN